MSLEYRRTSLLAALCCCGIFWFAGEPPSVEAQEDAATTATLQVRESPATQTRGENVDRSGPSAKKPNGKPGMPPDGEASDEDSKKDTGEKPAGESDDKTEGPAPTLRPTEPETAPDSDELNVEPIDGLVSFSFKGQPWPAVLQWLADISDMSLEWQEAPAGYLDLTTRRQYTVPEVRDLINSVLLARGYTLLRSGEILLVVKLDKLDVSLVPRVTSAELDERGTYEIVKTFFDLNRLRADVVAEELKPLLSPHGKITALKTTNRVEVVETAGNLRRLRDLLADEQDASGQEFQVREFPLTHVRADDVLETLNTLLGIDSKKSAAPMTPEQMQQQQEQMRRAMEQAKRQGGKQPQPAQKDEPKVHLAVNRRNNSVVAHAAPDQLAIIEQAVEYLDVRQALPASVSPLASVARIRNYRLTGAEPAAVIKVLQEMGNLSPSTQMVTDDANGAIIANAPMVDHITIAALVEQLNGSGRTFEVIQLRRLDAEYVAGSIEFLMRGPQEDTSRRSYYWYRSRNDEEEEDKFQVEADTQNNRLLLRANEVELEEIRQLLIKLGEDPYSPSHGSTMRVIRATPGDETEQLIERLRRLWPTISPNPLDVDPAEPPPTSDDSNDTGDEVESQQDQTKPVGPVTSPAETRDTITAVDASDARLLAAHFPSIVSGTRRATAKQSTIPAEQPPSRETPQPQSGAPVSITRGPQGLVITSRDPQALEAMVDLVNQIHAAQPNFRIFQLRHTYATDIALLLEDIFEDKEDEDNGFSPFFFYFDDRPSDDNQRSRLSSRRPLKFIPDSVTNTVLVQNADDSQLAEVEKLLELYDRIEPPDSQSVRKTQMVSVHYGDAAGIAAVVKDVYLDLLSPNDEALAKNRQQQQEPRQRYSYFGTSTSDDDNKLPRFKGLLSVGVDAEANMLVVSAPQFLLTDVEELIRELDNAARPLLPVVRVMQPGNSLSNALINQALTGGNGQGGISASAAGESRADRERREDRRRREERYRDRD